MGAMHMNTGHHVSLLARFDRGLSLKETIFETVRDGDTVVDAGCGTGILSLWAAKAGARKVFAIDSGDISIGQSLAKENGVSDQIEFIRSDLSNFELPERDRCNVLLGMVYFNDPRRDAAQSKLTTRLREELLRPDGTQIPDRVVYTVGVLEWSEQDINTHFTDVHRQMDMIEQKYDLLFGTLRDASTHSPNPSWYPVRKNSGWIERKNSRLLSTGTEVLAEIRYESGFQGYPERCECQITQPGICNVLLFTQYLYAGKRLIFSNESISWIRNPELLDRGASVHFALDQAWFETNIVTMGRL